MTIERTNDYRRVRRLLDKSQNDQGNPWEIIISSDVFYLIEVQGGEDVGVWAVEPQKNGDYIVHTAMSPACRGKAALDSARAALRWFYEHTGADIILGTVPKRLKHASRVPREVGFVYEGIKGEFRIYKMTRDLFNKQGEVT